MTQVTLAEIDKVSFYNQKEWLEEYESGKGIFYYEYVDDENCTCSEDNDCNSEESSSEEDESSDIKTEEIFNAYSCLIVFLLIFLLFLRSSTAFLSYKKRLSHSIYDTKK